LVCRSATCVPSSSATKAHGSSRQEIIATLSPGDPLALRPEPRTLEPNGIAVVAQEGVICFLPSTFVEDFVRASASPQNATVVVDRIVEDKRETDARGVWI